MGPLILISFYLVEISLANIHGDRRTLVWIEVFTIDRKINTFKKVF